MLKDVIPDMSRIALTFNPDTAPYYDVFPSFVRTGVRVEHDRSDGDSGSQCRTDRDDYRLRRSKSWQSLIAAADPFIVVQRDVIISSGTGYVRYRPKADIRLERNLSLAAT